MTQTSGTQQAGTPGPDKSAIRPFPKVKVPETELTELRRRIKTRAGTADMGIHLRCEIYCYGGNGLELRRHEDPDERLGSEFYNERQYL